jgi:HPr kinase/phosphorylase
MQMKKLLPILIGLSLSGFSSLSQAENLMQVYQQARLSNPELRKSAADRDAAFEKINEARSPLLPQLGLGADYTYSNGYRDANGINSNATSASLQLTQSIFDMSKWRALTLQEKAAGIQDVTYQTDQQTLILNTATAYFNVLNAIDVLSYTQAQKEAIYREFMAYDIPCVIFCRDLKPDEMFLKIAEESNLPVFGTKRSTSEFMAELIYCLSEQLAPCITIHGVLVDVYGEGLLIMGESGIGKSEAALELVRRGHRLVTDDVVEIRKINEHTLIGTSPDITRYFIELRGIGIIDVKTLFGVEGVKEKQQIDLVIKLEDWKKDNEYDRLGLEEEYTEFLGNKVVCHSLPIRAGRNLAVICEAAAVNHRQKKMGYNAAQELYRRVQENLTKKSDDEEDE